MRNQRTYWLCLLLWLSGSFSQNAWAQCDPCSPSMGSAMSGGMRSVYIDPSINPNDYGTIWSAFPEISSAFGGLRGMVDYQQTGSPSGASIQIYGVDVPDPTRPDVGATTVPNGDGGGYIRIKNAYLDGQHGGLLWNIAMHEGMHTANFHDLTGCSPTSSQMATPISAGGPWANGPTGNDYCSADRAWRGDVSPIVIALDGGRIRLSSLRDGVQFDIRGVGKPDRVAWPTDTDEGFLALDRNGNGIIDDGQELFGNFTPLARGGRASNGFEALAEFDANHDGWVDGHDPIFRQLRIWVDRNRDGVCDPDELLSLPDAGIAALSVEYTQSSRIDRWGNEFRYRGRVIPTSSGRARESWDVFLRDLPALRTQH
jgi:hypothetical protein